MLLRRLLLLLLHVLSVGTQKIIFIFQLNAMEETYKKLFNLTDKSILLNYLCQAYDHPSDCNIPKKYLKNYRTLQLYHVWNEMTHDEYEQYKRNGNFIQIKDRKGRNTNVRVSEKFFYLKPSETIEYLEANGLTHHAPIPMDCEFVFYYEDENGVIVID